MTVDAHDCACWIGVEVEGARRGERILCIARRLSLAQWRWALSQTFTLCFVNDCIALDHAFVAELLARLPRETTVLIGVADSADARAAAARMPADLRRGVSFVYRVDAGWHTQVRACDHLALGVSWDLVTFSAPVRTRSADYAGDVGCPV